MAKSLTARFGLQRWSVDSDTQQRSEFDNDAAQIEALAAMATHGAIGARPAASAATRDMFYMITDATGGGVVGTLYYCDGTTWTPFVGRDVRLASLSMGIEGAFSAGAFSSRLVVPTHSKEVDFVATLDSSGSATYSIWYVRNGSAFIIGYGGGVSSGVSPSITQAGNVWAPSSVWQYEPGDIVFFQVQSISGSPSSLRVTATFRSN